MVDYDSSSRGHDGSTDVLWCATQRRQRWCSARSKRAGLATRRTRRRQAQVGRCRVDESGRQLSCRPIFCQYLNLIL